MAPQSSTHSSFSEKLGQGHFRAVGNSKSNIGRVKIGERSMYSGGENYVRQPESPNATEASRTKSTNGRLQMQYSLLVCDLGRPGGLSLDSMVIRIDTEGDVLLRRQPSTVASVAEPALASTQLDSPSRPDEFQSTDTALYPRSGELATFENRKTAAIMKGLAEKESHVVEKSSDLDDEYVLEGIHPAIVGSNEERGHLSFPPCMPQQRNGLVAEDVRQHCLDAPSKEFPSACTISTSLSECCGPVGEAELEINIPIEEEELEVYLPIVEDGDVEMDEGEDTGSKNQKRRSNKDIMP